MSSYNNYVGLFDFRDINELAESLSLLLNQDLDTVYKRLFNEALSCGYNVKEAATGIGLIFHEFNDKMLEFYKSTDAFLFELSIIHMHPHAKTIDLEIIENVENEYAKNEDTEILLLGDGIGSDSLRFAELGYRTTYFEYESFSSKFAEYRFNKSGLLKRIHIIHNPLEIKKNSYDVVICREVLEHVPDPLNMISDIWSYLKHNGLAIITESFGRVEDNFPTHLASNSKYDGKTRELFIKEGFRIRESCKGNRLFIFRKVEKDEIMITNSFSIKKYKIYERYVKNTLNKIIRSLDII